MSKNRRPTTDKKASRKLPTIRGTRLLEFFWLDKVPKEMLLGAILIPKAIKINATIDATKYTKYIKCTKYVKYTK